MKFAVFSAQAKRDMVTIGQYVSRESVSRRVAHQLIHDLRTRCDQIANHDATLGRPRDELAPGLRSLVYKSYVLFFRYIDDDVEIVTILHGMRDIEALFGKE